MSSRDLPGLLESCTQTLVTSIRNYTEDQLGVLLNDESKLNSFIDNLSQINSISNDKEMKFVQSKSLAEYNLSMEQKLKTALLNLQKTHSDAVEKKKSVEEMKEKLDKISNSRSLDSVCSTLKALAHEAEKESEKISEDFHKGDLDIDVFVKQFCEKRATVHLRKIKEEKLCELLRQQQYNHSVATPNVYPIGNNTSTGSTQYPHYALLNDSKNYRHSFYS